MHDSILFKKADLFVHEIYTISRKFPKEELFGITSQMRRAGLSVVLNIVEGYARQNRNEFRRFLQISYASLQEVRYLLNFCHSEKLIDSEHHKKLSELSEEVSKMLWSSIRTIRNKN